MSKTTPEQLNFYVEILSKHEDDITSRKMFGEYGLYKQDKFFGLICQNKLFLKATEELQKLLQDDGVRPYEGAGSGYYHIPEELIETEKMKKLITASLDFVPKKKK